MVSRSTRSIACCFSAIRTPNQRPGSSLAPKHADLLPCPSSIAQFLSSQSTIASLGGLNSTCVKPRRTVGPKLLHLAVSICNSGHNGERPASLVRRSSQTRMGSVKPVQIASCLARINAMKASTATLSSKKQEGRTPMARWDLRIFFFTV